jgi:hypothetical protein
MMLEVLSKPLLGLNLKGWTEMSNTRIIPDMDACPDFFNRGDWPASPAFLSRRSWAGDLEPD